MPLSISAVCADMLLQRACHVICICMQTALVLCIFCTACMCCTINLVQLHCLTLFDPKQHVYMPTFAENPLHVSWIFKDYVHSSWRTSQIAKLLAGELCKQTFSSFRSTVWLYPWHSFVLYQKTPTRCLSHPLQGHIFALLMCKPLCRMVV